MTIAELLKKEGRAEGRKEGRAEGRKEGRVEGRDEEKRELVLRMYRKGYGLDTIAELSGLSIEQIDLIIARPS